MAKINWNQLSVVGVIAVLLGGLGGAFFFPSEKVVEVDVEKIVEVEVPYNVTVEVDNGNLDLVLQHIYDNEGNITYLTSHLDDDEIDEIVDRIVFINEIKTLAAAEVKSEGIDELDKEKFTYFDKETRTRVNVTFDDRDIERFRVDNDADEITVEDVDFEDRDAYVYVTTRFEQDDVKYKATFVIEFRDGEVEDIEVNKVSLR